MKNFASLYRFADKQEEIIFFKISKPKLHAPLLYYTRLLNILVRKPVAGSFEIKKFFHDELRHIRLSAQSHMNFYQYYRSEDSCLDEWYFLRQNQNHSAFSLGLDMDPAFSTGYDFLVAKILANDQVSLYLNTALSNADGDASGNKPLVSFPSKKLTWTDPKTGLTELAYALKTKGSFDNGKATLKEITDYFQSVFDIEISNPSRDFQEILRRKTGYTNYIDSLKESYLRYIDQIESRDRTK